MNSNITEQALDIQSIDDLKKRAIANAVATGATFAFHDLFSRIKEFSGADGGFGPGDVLLEKCAHLLPTEEDAESPEFEAATGLIEKYDLGGDTVPAAIVEATARRAIELGKFTYAGEAYKLLGIKKEMVALYAQAGEQSLREDKPRHAAMSFFVAASLDQPIEPNYQYLGPQLHQGCLGAADKCVTTLPAESLVDAGIHLMLPSESLGEKLMAAVKPEQKGEILGTLTVCRDPDLAALAGALKDAAAELARLEGGDSRDYSSVGAALLGRKTTSNEAWQYMRELCFEHPIAALCVCFKIVKNTPALVPVIRDGKPLIEHLLPPEFLKA